MLVMVFFHWWYGAGWRDTVGRIGRLITEVYFNFSVPILLKTLFAPWRRIISPAGTNLQQKLRALVDNAVSRAVGFTMRLILLITAASLMLGAILIGGLLIATWPLVPLLGPFLIVAGLVL